MPKKKTDLTSALSGLTSTDAIIREATGAAEQTTAPEPAKGSSKRETKRINLVLDADVHEQLDKIAFMKRTSVTGIINDILREYTEKNQEIAERFDRDRV